MNFPTDILELDSSSMIAQGKSNLSWVVCSPHQSSGRLDPTRLCCHVTQHIPINHRSDLEGCGPESVAVLLLFPVARRVGGRFSNHSSLWRAAQQPPLGDERQHTANAERLGSRINGCHIRRLVMSVIEYAWLDSEFAGGMINA
jgi:hypothetical protein